MIIGVQWHSRERSLKYPQGQGFMAATSMKRAGKLSDMAARAMVTVPSSNGCQCYKQARPHFASPMYRFYNHLRKLQRLSPLAMNAYRPFAERASRRTPTTRQPARQQMRKIQQLATSPPCPDTPSVPHP